MVVVVLQVGEWRDFIEAIMNSGYQTMLGIFCD
jgi:hypothetical protein